MAEAFDEEARRLGSALKEMERRTQGLTASANAFARAMEQAFTGAIAGGKRLDDVLKSLALRLSDLALRLALRPLTNALASALQPLLGGLSGSPGANPLSTPSSNASIAVGLQNALGYARGGVIHGPTYFPLSAGGVGLAGEAGPEAILPLARGPDGRLGVTAMGSGSVHVTVNIATPDAESFRRSEVYLTSQIARAVARGQRGL
jgi:lambda family phage tail tape measure protein